MTKILQTIAGFGAHSGGTSTCTYDLLATMYRIDYPVDLLTLQTTDLMGNGEQWIKALPNDGISSYGYSRNMNRFLQKSDYDLYHTNGMWMHCNHETCLVARKKDKPYVITPHGMLYPQALARSAWKKKLLLAMGGVANDLKSAACIHVTCKAEMLHYRALGYNNPVAVIPNPVLIPNCVEATRNKPKKKRIGFLGRLHPRKNVQILIDVWSKLGDETQNAELIIIGKGEEEYEAMLRNEVKRLGLNNVIFVGFITGREKFEKLASLTALCVPSDFENFGMIVTEALSVQTPVIACLGTPWEALNTHHCGWWVDNDIDTLAQTIREALFLPQSEIDKMGENGKLLVETNYTDTQVALKMKQLYEWILNGGEKPEFVYGAPII